MKYNRAARTKVFFLRNLANDNVKYLNFEVVITARARNLSFSAIFFFHNDNSCQSKDFWLTSYNVTNMEWSQNKVLLILDASFSLQLRRPPKVNFKANCDFPQGLLRVHEN